MGWNIFMLYTEETQPSNYTGVRPRAGKGKTKMKRANIAGTG